MPVLPYIAGLFAITKLRRNTLLDADVGLTREAIDERPKITSKMSPPRLFTLRSNFNWNEE
jgi:hypothetical protein